MGSQAIEVALHLLPRPTASDRARTRAAMRSSAALGAFALCLFAGVADDGLCAESRIRTQDFAASIEARSRLHELRAIGSYSLLLSQDAETPIERKHTGDTAENLASRWLLAQHGAAVQPKSGPTPERQRALEREQERDSAETIARALTSSLRAELDALQSSAEAARIKQRQALEQEREKAEALARELATLQAELDTARIVGKEAAEAIDLSIRQTEALEQERDKTNELKRELSFAREELEAARQAVSKALQTADAEIRQEQALASERDKAENLDRELAALRAELDAARIAAWEAAKVPPPATEQAQALDRERARADTLARELSSVRSDAAKAAAAEIAQRQALEKELKRQQDTAEALSRELAAVRKDAGSATEQKQALERKLKQQRGAAEASGRELALLRTELDKARGIAEEATRSVETAKVEQKQALEKERGRAETLARELALTRKQAEEGSARLAAAHAEILQATETGRAGASEQKAALAAERERADAVARELASVGKQLDARNRQLAVLKASGALIVVDGLPEWVATSRSAATQGTSATLLQTSIQAPAVDHELSSAPDAKPPPAQPTAHERVPVVESNAAAVPPPFAPGRALPRSLVDEQRLLARAIALLRQADISGARPVLEHAAQRGSARAAFMLAETYDERVLQSWRVRGISGDLTKARELYEIAQSGGIEDAKERIKKLQPLSVRSSPTQGR